MRHGSAVYATEFKCNDRRDRCFRFDENNRGMPVPPRSTETLASFEYCVKCAVEQTGEGAIFGGVAVAEMPISAKVWIDGREYCVEKTVNELSLESEARTA